MLKIIDPFRPKLAPDDGCQARNRERQVRD
jgi:hypothetical protein